MNRVIRVLCAVISSLLIIQFTSTETKATSGCEVYGRRDNASMKIALTFDDGPHPVYTEAILDILKEYGITATFFMVGENVGYYKGTAKRVADEGHEIGNHTFSHTNAKCICQSELKEEFEKCERVISEVCGITPVLFRPPEGVVDNCIKTITTEKNCKIILWSIDTRDWAENSVKAINKAVFDNIRSGDIVLMHDYLTKRCHTVEALKIIIPGLIDMGYNFVTVSELLNE